MNNIGVLSVSTTLISSAADQCQPDDESSRPKEFHILAPPGSNAGGGKDDCEGDSPVEEKDSPVEERDSPVEEKDSPVEEGDSPVEEKDSPVDERDSPVEEKDSPVEERDSPVEYEDNQSSSEVIGECLNGACIKALFCEPLSLFYCRPCSHIWW